MIRDFVRGSDQLVIEVDGKDAKLTNEGDIWTVSWTWTVWTNGNTEVQVSMDFEIDV